MRINDYKKHRQTFLISTQVIPLALECPPWLFLECICMCEGQRGQGDSKCATPLEKKGKKGDAVRGCKLSVSLKPAALPVSPSHSLPALYAGVIPSALDVCSVNALLCFSSSCFFFLGGRHI